MSHAYPLGTSIEDALKPEAEAARTRAEAEALAGDGLQVVALTTDWLPVSEEAAEAMLAAGGEGAHGHLQRYEDDKGSPVIAVTWWKLEAETKKKKAAKPKAPEPAAEADHTDDLYFRRGRTKPSRRRYVDPRQLDLFRSKSGD
ncbi:MAG: hypothetical protein KDA53_13415 [Hyphomonas sp.]|nr:hypothetical protein [Hyphomonas sp.]